MDLDHYQHSAAKTAIYPSQGTFGGLIYCALKLNGEAGELAEKVGKIMRDDGNIPSPEKTHAMALELGDVLWYVANAAVELGYSLNGIADLNLQKLADRKARSVLGGSGDNR